MFVAEPILDVFSFLSDIQLAKRYHCGKIILWSIAELVLLVICLCLFAGEIYVPAVICLVGFLLSTVFFAVYYSKKI